MKRNRRGFTLIELMVVIAIIIILAAIAIPNYINMTHRAQASKATSDAAVIATALEVYRTDYGTYPATLAELTTGTVGWQGYTSEMKDYLTTAAIDQIQKNEKTMTYSVASDVWTLTIETLDGQTGTRTSTGPSTVTWD